MKKENLVTKEYKEYEFLFLQNRNINFWFIHNLYIEVFSIISKMLLYLVFLVELCIHIFLIVN
jgi:hypothetical protein